MLKLIEIWDNDVWDQQRVNNKKSMQEKKA